MKFATLLFSRTFSVALSFAILLGASNSYALHGTESQLILDKLEDYEKCESPQHTGKSCHEALTRWVQAHPADAFKAGKLTRPKMNDSVAISFFVMAFDTQAGDCRDRDVAMAVEAALRLPSDYAAVPGAQKIAFTYCASQFKYLADSVDTTRPDYLKNVCEFLSRAKGLNERQQEACKSVK